MRRGSDTSQKGNLTSDLNGDGETNPAYVSPSDHSVNGFATQSGIRPSDPRWDVSGDGSVTSLDTLMILQTAAGDLIL